MSWQPCPTCSNRFNSKVGQYTQCFNCSHKDWINCLFCGKSHSPKWSCCFTCKRDRDQEAKDLRLMILMRDDFSCMVCGDRDGEMRIDHIKPIRAGGVPRQWNMRVICNVCSEKKGISWTTEHEDALHAMEELYLVRLWDFLDESERRELDRDVAAYLGEGYTNAGKAPVFTGRYREYVHWAGVDPLKEWREG